jgi:hypothetical protein
MVEYIVVKIASDSVDAFILALAQIGVILGSFSAGASILLLADYFKRHTHKKIKEVSKRSILGEGTVYDAPGPQPQKKKRIS